MKGASFKKATYCKDSIYMPFYKKQQKSDQWLPGAVGVRNVPFNYCAGGYTITDICQNKQNCSFKKSEFYCM